MEEASRRGTPPAKNFDDDGLEKISQRRGDLQVLFVLCLISVRRRVSILLSAARDDCLAKRVDYTDVKQKLLAVLEIIYSDVRAFLVLELSFLFQLTPWSEALTRASLRGEPGTRG